MRIYIISPARPDDIWRKRRSTFTLPQMSLAILAALTPPDIEAKVTDELVEDIDFSYPADAVALSVNTTTSVRSYEVARAFRERGVRVIMGGIHPSVLPDEAGAEADAVVVGEAEGVWAKVISDLRAGKLSPRYEGCHPDAGDIPSPRWDFLNGKRYFVQRTFQVSRGCPHGCGFCSSTSFFGTRYRFRPLENVVREIKSYGKDFVVFVDDNIAGNADYARELFKALKPLGKRWVAQSSVDIVNKDGLLELARESGCAGFLFGLESISYDNKSTVRKLRHASEYRELIRETRGRGIGVHGSFVFGLDGDNPDVFENTVDFVLENKLEVANYCILTPYPGTKIYEEFSAAGRITEKDWSRFDRYNVVYRPRGISAEELKRYVDAAYARTFSPGSILKRMPARLGNIPYYLGINFSYWMGARRRA